MNLVTVKNKFQIVIPQRVRKQAGIEIGDLLEVNMTGDGIVTLNPQSLIDRRIAESLKDYEEGRYGGTFNSAKELISSLKSEVKKRRRDLKSHR